MTGKPRLLLLLVATALLAPLGAAAAEPTAPATEPEAPAASETAPPAAPAAPEPAPPETTAPEPAETAAAKGLPSFFATTTVTAVGHEVDTFRVATPVTVIPALELERRQPANASDLLRTEPGVDVNGVGPSQSRPIIRGQRGLRVLFLENGLRMNNARREANFGEIPSLVDLDNVQSVEVVRGPASVLYGSDAIGGVLNLITKLPTVRAGRRLGGEAGLRYGSAGDLGRAHAAVSGELGRVDFALGGSYRDVGDYRAPSGDFGRIHLARETTVHDTNLTDKSFHGYVGAHLTDRQSLALRFNRYRADETGFGYVDPAAIGDTSGFLLRILYPYQRFDRTTLVYDGTALASPVADSLSAQGYYQDNERTLTNDITIDIGPVSPGSPSSDISIRTKNLADIETYGLRAEAIKVAGSRHLFTYGGEYFRDRSRNTDHGETVTTIRIRIPPPVNQVIVQQFRETSDRSNVPNALNTSYGLFAQDELAVGDRVKITAGGRYQKVSTEAQATPGWDTSGMDFSDDQVVGALTATFQVLPELNVLASYGTAFRAPNIIERLFDGPTPEGSGFQIQNPSLGSERSGNWDVGLKYRRRDAFMEAIFFRNEIDDAIIRYQLTASEVAGLPADVRARIPPGPGTVVVQQRNVDRLRFEGVEVSLGWRSRAGLTLGGNYTHLTGKSVGAQVIPVDNQYSEKFNAFARFEPTGGRYWAEYRLRHNGSQSLDPGQQSSPIGRSIPAFTVHALAGGVTLFERPSQRHELLFRVDNLTDELYAEFSNATFFRPEPGRSYGVSYRVKL